MGTSTSGAGQRESAEQTRERVDRFDAIVDSHGPDLMRRAIWLTRTTAEAWDLYQDTVERALRSHSNRIPVEKVRNWLHIIMHNLFVDRCRAPASRSWRSLTDDLLERLCAVEATKEAWWWSLDSAAIDRAKSALSPPLQDVFSMHAQGRSYSEIAAKLAIPINTVATRMRRARHSMRGLLETSAGRASRD